jgi:hypothetical protein
MRKGTKIHMLDTQRFSIGTMQLQQTKSYVMPAILACNVYNVSFRSFIPPSIL